MKATNVFVTILLVSAVLSLLVGGSGATWCDTDYAKRINISVNNTGGSALTDYQVFINLSSNPINETSLQVYNASDCASRDFWCEEISAGNCTKLWIKYSAIGASAWTNNTAIYYDNAAVSSASNGPTTFELFDDFTDNSTIATDQTTKDTVYDTTRYALASHIIKLHDGTLFAVFCEGDAHGSQNNHDVKWINSTDNGSTWSSPQTITAHVGITDARNAGCLEFNDSGTWTILAYYDKQTSSAGDAYCKKSTDSGQTWGSEITVTSNNNRYTWGTGIEMSNGSLIFATYSYPTCACQAQISSDGGDNWTEYSISSTNGMSETSIIEKTTNGHLLAIIRNFADGKKYTSTSTDYGQTWSAPADMSLTASDSPVTVTRLNDGDMLMSWEQSNSDFRVARSSDEGATWNTAGSYSIYYDASMPANAGYVSSVQINNTHVYSLFYVQHATGHADIYGNDVDISDAANVWYKTGTPTLDYSNGLLRIHGTDNSDHRLTSMKTFSAPHVMESRSKINWSGTNYVQMGFGLFNYSSTIPGYVGSFAVVKDRSSADALSHWVNSNGSGTAQYTDGSTMNAYFVNKIKWKSDEVKNIHTGGTITHTTYIPTISLPVVIGGMGYLSHPFDMYLDWLFVRKYASPEPSTTLGTEEQQGVNPILHIGNAINIKEDWGRDFNSNFSANVTVANASDVWMNFTNSEFTNTSLGNLNLTLNEWINESHNVNAPITNISVDVYLNSTTSGATNDTDSFWYEITKRTNTATMDSAATQNVDTSESFYVNATCNEEHGNPFYGAANLLEDGAIIDTDTSVTNYVNFSHSESSIGQYNYTIRFYNLTHYDNATTSTYSNVTVSGGEYPPGTPQNLTNTTGNFWVNHTWSIINGMDNVTDSFNVSVNLTWYNGTTNFYHNNTLLSAHKWSNITVWSFNNSGNGSLGPGSVSDDVQIPNNVVSLTVTQNYNKLETQAVFISDTASSDADGDTPTYSCNRTDLFTDFSTVTGYGNWTTGTTDAGTYYVDIGVSDGWGSTDNKTLTIIITDATPGIPSGLANTTGNFWVNHTWSGGANTDTFNVSVNLSWSNSSSNEYYNNTPLSAHKWSNVSVHGFNSTSGETSSGISQNTQIPNNLPVLSGLPDNTTDEDINQTDIFDLDNYFTDADGDTPTYLVESNNQSAYVSATINASNNVSYTLASGWNGTASVVINVTDGWGGEDNDTFLIVVNAAPLPGDYIPGDPTTLQNTTGNYWVNYTWNVGGGNVTDSYNVSWNLTWYNNTLVAYMNDTVGEFGWANISVWAFNSSGNGSTSAGSISDETQAGGGTYTTSMTITVYNLITYYGSASSTVEQFGIDIGSVDYIAKYNGSFWSHTMGYSANNFTTYHGIGYYVYLNASGSSTYQRNNISDSPYNTQLFNRWNTIGWTNATNTNAEGIATSIGSACKYTSMLNADGVTYTTHTVGFTSNNHAVDKGKGYWVWANTGLSWSRNS